MLSAHGQGIAQGPDSLRFRSLVDSIAACVAGVVDTRQLGKVRFALRDCYLSALALFYLQDPSLLQFQRRFQDQVQANNLSSTFGVAQIPSDSQSKPFVEQLRAARFSFLLVAKPGDHRSLYQDVAGLRRGNLLNRHHTDHRGERQEYEWVTDLALNGNPNSAHINFFQFRILKAGTVT